MKQKRLWMIAAILTICGACIITCCSSNDNPSEQTAGYIPKAPDYSDPASAWPRTSPSGRENGKRNTKRDKQAMIKMKVKR